MAKLYNESLPEQVRPSGPRKETIQMLLNYSKALSVHKYNDMVFETLNN